MTKHVKKYVRHAVHAEPFDLAAIVMRADDASRADAGLLPRGVCQDHSGGSFYIDTSQGRVYLADGDMLVHDDTGLVVAAYKPEQFAKEYELHEDKPKKAAEK